MIRIIQLSDFHINTQNLNDWNNYIKKALLEKLNKIKDEQEITFIAFTGDLIDRGGSDFDSAETAFKSFEKEIIKPILESLKLPIEKFLIIPGNHDVVRSADSKRSEIGSKSYFLDAANISDFIENALKDDNYDGMNRIKPYKKFEKELYENIEIPHKITIFGSSFIINNKQKSIGVACLNSAWRCYDNNDKGNLIVGESQLIEHTKFIENTDIKIALVHHPIDMLTNVEAKLILSHLHKDYDVLLFGDSHETFTSMTTGFTGSLFMNLAPSGLSDIRSDSRRYSNGFTVLDIDVYNNKICTQYFRYNHNKKEYVVNTDSGNTIDGKFCQNIPDEERKKDINIISKALDNIKDNHYALMNDCMIGVKVDNIDVSCIKDAFILPPITLGKSLSNEEETPDITINQIVKANYHQMFFGSKESGKTVLLYRLVREFVDEYHYTRRIPIYFNLDEIGNKEIETVLKEYLSFNTKELTNLIESNEIILLVDNLDYKDMGDNIERIKKLEKFVDNNSNVLVIATGDGDISSGVPPIDYIEYCKIPFKNFFIQNLRSQEIKSIIKLWIPNEDSIKMEDRLDKMVNDFSSFSLPSNAMSVSLFLWSTEHSDRKPINNSVLLDIYIEIILEKLNKDNIYRGSFDFTNKVQLLASIAQEMLISGGDNYSLSYSDYLRVIESYLDKVGFQYESDKIAEYFVRRKLFAKFQGNRVKFSQSCFFHFFLGKRMEFNTDFRDFVLSEENYSKYIHEIDYYSGLVRSDRELLETIYERFKKEFSKTDHVFPQLDNIWDRFFIVKLKEDGENDDEIKFVSKAKNTEISTIKENRPSEKMIEEFQNRRLSQITEPGKILKKDGNVNLELLLVLMSLVLRNSETVEDIKLKKEIYNSLVKYTMIWSVLYREYIMDYILKHDKLPPTLSTNTSVRRTLANLPLHVQGGMQKWVGTPKLAKVIRSKIESDLKGNSFTKSDLELFFSVALYGDIQGDDYTKYYKKLIKQLKNTPVRDYTFYKLVAYYYRRTREGSPNEEIYLDMISDLKMKELNMPNRMKQKVINSYKTAKKNLLR